MPAPKQCLPSLRPKTMSHTTKFTFFPIYLSSNEIKTEHEILRDRTFSIYQIFLNTLKVFRVSVVFKLTYCHHDLVINCTEFHLHCISLCNKHHEGFFQIRVTLARLAHTCASESTHQCALPNQGVGALYTNSS